MIKIHGVELGVNAQDINDAGFRVWQDGLICNAKTPDEVITALSFLSDTGLHYQIHGSSHSYIHSCVRIHTTGVI